MLIKGIRSFSPDNQHVIEFYKPLTLIVGQNGAGKTVQYDSFIKPVPVAAVCAVLLRSLNIGCRRLLSALSKLARVTCHPTQDQDRVLFMTRR
jgi:predicted ATPase